jgi:thiol:disulfide interchange protein DsbA
MNRRDFSRTAAGALLATGASWTGLARAEGEWVEGRHYVRLSQPAPVNLPAGKAVEVLEFFWYECPHCYAFEPAMDAWIAKLPADVMFRRMPVGFTARHQVAQKAFFALQEMGELDRLHPRIFAAIHLQRQRLMTEKAYVDFVAGQGVDGDKFATMMRSFSVNAQAKRATQLCDAYRVDGTPSMGVQGRFYTTGSLAGGNDAMLKVTEHLIGVSRKA